MTISPPTMRLDEELLHQFPDMALMAMLDAALVATAAVLWEEHQPEPELLLDPDHCPEAACLTTHVVLSSISQLRHALRLHLAELKRALPPADPDYRF